MTLILMLKDYIVSEDLKSTLIRRYEHKCEVDWAGYRNGKRVMTGRKKCSSTYFVLDENYAKNMDLCECTLKGAKATQRTSMWALLRAV